MTKRSQKCVQLSGQSTASKHRQRALNVRSTRRNKKQPRRRPWKIRTRRRQQTSVVRTKEHGTSHRLGGTDVKTTMEFINLYFEIIRVWLDDTNEKVVNKSPTEDNKYKSAQLKIYIFVSKKATEIDVGAEETYVKEGNPKFTPPADGNRYIWYSCTTHANVDSCTIGDTPINTLQLTEVLEKN